MARTKKSTARKNDSGLCLALLDASSTPLEVERVLAGQNMDRWKRIQQCKDSIRQHQGRVRYYKRQLKELERQHEKVTLVTRLLRDPLQHWDSTPASLRFQKPIVLALLKADVPLPLELHEQFWNSETPAIPKKLRCDKEIFLARLHRWSQTYFLYSGMCVNIPISILKQKDVLSKLLGIYPKYLLQKNVPDFVFDDCQVLEGILTNSTCPVCDLLQILPKFSPRIRNKSDLMIRTVLQICSISGAYDQRAARRPHTSFVGDQLRSEKDFCMQVTNAVLTRFPDCKDRRRACPLWLRDLPLPLRSDADIAAAFCRVNGLNMSSATDRIRSIPSVLHAACEENPSVIVHVANASRRLLLTDSEFIRRAFEETKHNPNKTIQVFKLLPGILQEDIELNVLACLQASSLLKVVKHRWKDDKRFWLRLFAGPCDPFNGGSTFAWDDIPIAMRGDIDVARVFAGEHCRTLIDLENIVAAHPTLLLGEDEDFLFEITMRFLTYETGDEFPFLLTILPVGWNENRSLCMRLIGEHAFIYEYLTMDLRLDREIVEVTLGQVTVETFNDLMDAEVQALFPDLIAQWIRDNIDDPDYLLEFDVSFIDELWDNRDFVMAFTEVGGGLFSQYFGFDYDDYRDDREVMLALGSFCPAEFAGACPFKYLREKEFMLQAISLNPYLLKFAHSSLHYDADFLLRAFAFDQGIISFIDGDFCDSTIGSGAADGSISFDGEPGEERGTNGRLKLAVLARSVREKLDCYRGFWTLLQGIGSRRELGDFSPTSLLNQGAETSIAYKLRIAEFLGVPLGTEFHHLRQLSTELTKWGY